MLKCIKMLMNLPVFFLIVGVGASPDIKNLYSVKEVLRVLFDISFQAYVANRATMLGCINKIENQIAQGSIIIQPVVEDKIKECKALLNGSPFTDNKIDFIAKVNAIINEINHLQVSPGANYQTEIRSHYRDIEEYERTHASL